MEAPPRTIVRRGRMTGNFSPRFFASAVAEIPFDSAKRNVLEGRRRSDGPDAANEKANNW